MRSRGIDKIALCFVFAILGFFFLTQYQRDFSSSERELCITLLAAYVVVGALVILAAVRHGLYLLEPFSFAAVWYIAIFIYRPIVDLNQGRMMGNGVYVLPGGVKATILFTLGFFCFYLGYYCRPMKRTKPWANHREETLPEEHLKADERPISTNWALIGWAISYVFCLIALTSGGSSLRYIFSLASSGEKVVDENNVALLFLSNFGITMVTCWLMIIVRPGKWVTKIAITVLSLIYLIMRNGRWLLLIFALSPVVYHYVKRRRRPSLPLIFGGGLALLFVFAWMQFNRGILHSGGRMLSWGQVGFSMDTLLSPFDSDLSTYKVFYSMVTRFPSNYPYMMGQTFAYTVVMFVPRILWRTKPEHPIRDLIENSMNNLARRSGSAVANIGEYYGNFGILGVVILMFLFGYILSKMKSLYREPSEDRLVAYAILFPLLFQWVARGNFCGNFYLTIFAMLPFILRGLFQTVVRRRP